MLHNHIVNDPANDSRLERLSRHRPPQYNDENCGCGYRCGWGCEPFEKNPGDGQGTGSETELTLVGDGSAAGSPQDDSDGYEAYGQRNLMHEFDERFLEAVPHVDSSQNLHIIGWEGIRSQPPSPRSYDDMPESLDVRPCPTEDHSPIASNSGSAGPGSPGLGFDPTVTPDLIVEFPCQYLFLVSPLSAESTV